MHHSIPAQLQQFRQRLTDEAAAMQAAAATQGTRSAAAATAAANDAGLITGYYVLKTGEHLGQGLQIVPSSKALSAFLERNKAYLKPPGDLDKQAKPSSSNGSASNAGSGSSNGGGGSSSSGAAGNQSAAEAVQARLPRPFICVQQYITRPLLVQGRKFGLRLWVLVLGPEPFRAYLYCNGLVLFSREQYNAHMDAVEAEGAATLVRGALIV